MNRMVCMIAVYFFGKYQIMDTVLNGITGHQHA